MELKNIFHVKRWSIGRTIFWPIIFNIIIVCSLFAQSSSDFEFHGYARSGFGVNGENNPIEAFQAPNSEAKYRLGNEAETYAEAVFNYNMASEKGAHFKTSLCFAYVTPTSKSNDFITTTSIREVYVQANSLFDSAPDIAFWAGQRFYDRHQPHIDDFWYRDMSGFGGGIENIPVGNDINLSIAFLDGSSDELRSDGTVYPENEYFLNKLTADISLYNVKFLDGDLGMNVIFSNFNGDSIATIAGPIQIDGSDGWALGIFYVSTFTDIGFNKTNIFYGRGAAENYKAIITKPLGLEVVPNSRINVSKIKRFRVINEFLLDFPKWSVQGVLMYQQLDNGQNTNNILHWYSAGLRPAYHISTYFSIEFEAGWDYTSQKNLLSGSLYKLTVAPQITPMAKALSRPSLRAFMTYAIWSDSFMGFVAPKSFINATRGFTFGVQMETWW